MRIDILSAVPEILSSPIDYSIIKRARNKNIVEIFIHNLHDYAFDSYKQIDDKPYAGGGGMVLKPEPIYRCYSKLISERKYDQVFLMCPKGEIFSQKEAKNISLLENIIFICGHYKGIDERVSLLTGAKPISIGKFVLSGGEIPALVIIDSVIRLIPGVLGDANSALTDSYIDDIDTIDAPVYTRPRNFEGLEVPNILVSGNHSEIKIWKDKLSVSKKNKCNGENNE